MLVSYLRKSHPLEEQKKQHPTYYHERANFTAFKPKESHQIIDLQTCPVCFEVRIVYDCPRGDCKKREVRPLGEYRDVIFAFQGVRILLDALDPKK